MIVLYIILGLAAVAFVWTIFYSNECRLTAPMFTPALPARTKTERLPCSSSEMADLKRSLGDPAVSGPSVGQRTAAAWFDRVGRRLSVHPRFSPFIIISCVALVAQAAAADLPFDRETINRYSLDHLPRSLSIRQGPVVWLGYDLERAKVYKVWQAPAGKPGLITTGFVTKSAGATWFEDTSSETWHLQRDGKTVPLTIRYLGCSQRADYFELTWELRHDSGFLKLQERIPQSPAAGAGRAVRELRVESLVAGEVLRLPIPAGEQWNSSPGAGMGVPALTGSGWHRLALP